MKITLVNVEDDLLSNLVKDRTDGTGKEVVFFDWLSTTTFDEKVVFQIKELTRCKDNQIPVIIFDRYSSMKDEEVMFLHRKTKAQLLEPSVIARVGFEFMPYWIHFKKFSYYLYDTNRKYQTGYKGDIFTNDLEMCLLSLIKDDIKIGVDTLIPQEKYDLLKSLICIDRFEWSDINTMILTGTRTDYNIGKLPDIRPLLDNNVIPILYHKHKWLHSIFKQFIVEDGVDIKWFVDMYKKCGGGLLEDLQKNIIRYLPEMEANNFVDSIINRANRL